MCQSHVNFILVSITPEFQINATIILMRLDFDLRTAFVSSDSYYPLAFRIKRSRLARGAAKHTTPMGPNQVIQEHSTILAT